MNVAQSSRDRRAAEAMGNAHPQIVPYEAFETADGFLVIGVGNDDQWRNSARPFERMTGLWIRASVRTPSWPRIARSCWRRCDPWCGSGRASIGKSYCRRSACRMGRSTRGRRALAGPQVAAREMILPVVDNQGRAFRCWPARSITRTSRGVRRFRLRILASIPTKSCASGSTSIAPDIAALRNWSHSMTKDFAIPAADQFGPPEDDSAGQGKG